MNTKQQGLLVLAIVMGFGGISYLIMTNSSKSTATETVQVVSGNQQTNTNPQITQKPITTTQTNSTKNNYTSKITYAVPRGSEYIEVQTRIENGIITDINTSHSGYDHHSVLYQNDFDNEIKSYVIGKSIDEISLSRVAGASDTTSAFMDALDSIQKQI